MPAGGFLLSFTVTGNALGCPVMGAKPTLAVANPVEVAVTREFAASATPTVAVMTTVEAIAMTIKSRRVGRIWRFMASFSFLVGESQSAMERCCSASSIRSSGWRNVAGGSGPQL